MLRVGTYYVDPQVPMLDPSKRHKEKSSEPFPNASFRTVHDNIDIHLATTGDARAHPKANIRVGTKDGLVKVTLVCHLSMYFYIWFLSSTSFLLLRQDRESG